MRVAGKLTGIACNEMQRDAQRHHQSRAEDTRCAARRPTMKPKHGQRQPGARIPEMSKPAPSAEGRVRPPSSYAGYDTSHGESWAQATPHAQYSHEHHDGMTRFREEDTRVLLHPRPYHSVSLHFLRAYSAGDPGKAPGLGRSDQGYTTRMPRPVTRRDTQAPGSWPRNTTCATTTDPLHTGSTLTRQTLPSPILNCEAGVTHHRTRRKVIRQHHVHMAS